MISVYKRDDSAAYGAPPGTVVHNIRHCNDRLSCVACAPDARKPDVKTGREPHSLPGFDVKIG